MFRFSSRAEYESAIINELQLLLISGSIDEDSHNDLVDEYISFCEVSGSVR